MPSNPRIPSYRRHPSGQAIVTLSGVMHYLGPFGTKISRDEYDRVVAEWLANNRQSLPRPQAVLISVAELFRDYWEFAQTYYRKNGAATGELQPIRAVIKFVGRLYGRQAAAEFQSLQLLAVQDAMIRSGMARTTINRQCERLRRIFRWAVARKKVPEVVLTSLASVSGLRRERSLAREPDPIRAVTDAEVAAVLPHLSPIVADMVRLQMLTGCRPGEVCVLTPGSLDRSNDNWIFRPVIHKLQHHDKQRDIPIVGRAKTILEPYLNRDPDVPCFSPAESEVLRRAEQSAGRKTPIAYGNRPGSNCKRSPQRKAGSGYSVASYRRAIERACLCAYPPPAETSADPGSLRAWKAKYVWSPNQLRHHAATRLSQLQGMNGVELARALLGHSTVATTAIYIEEDRTKAMEAAILLQGAGNGS
jgi:integrase